MTKNYIGFWMVVITTIVCATLGAGCIERTVPQPPQTEETVDMFSVKIIDYGSGRQASSDGGLLVFLPDDDPSWSTTFSFANVPIISGIGQADMSNTGLRTFTQYNFVSHVDGYYDETWSSTLSKNPSEVIHARKIGSFEELLITNATDGSVNDQTDVSPLNEIRIIDENTVCYNKSNGDGLFRLDLTIRTFGNNEYLKNPVFVIYSNEGYATPPKCVYDVSVARLRGCSDIYLPAKTNLIGGNIIRSPVYNLLEGPGYLPSGTSAIYQVQFIIDECECDPDDSVDIIIDDLGDFVGSDIRGGFGADAKMLTILFE